MKRSDIDVLGTIYAREHNRASTRRHEPYEGIPCVVLSSEGNWHHDNTIGVVRYRADEYVSSHMKHGLPGLSLATRTPTATQLDELLNLATLIWPTVRAGECPELPEHVRLHVAPTRTLVEPWVDYAPKAQARREAAEVAVRNRDANVRVEAGARDRLVEILPVELLRGRRFEESYRAGTAAITIKWSDIELFAKAYAAVVLGEAMDEQIAADGTDMASARLAKRQEQLLAESKVETR